MKAAIIKIMSTQIRKKPVKVMVFGTFDGLHPGHLSFFKQARALNPQVHLVVSVARDKNVLKIKKRHPVFGEKKRVRELKKSKLVHKVILGGEKNYFLHIQKENPDVIALGYDQRAYVSNLKRDLKKKNMKTKVVRLKPYKKSVYKSSLLNISEPKSHKKPKK
jgi:FAD synthetase